MRKWTDARDTIVNALDVNSMTEEVKEQQTQNIIAELYPAIEAAADKFTATIKEQAANETGWNKIRDSIVLPCVIDGTIYLAKYVLNKTVTKTTETQA